MKISEPSKKRKWHDAYKAARMELLLQDKMTPRARRAMRSAIRVMATAGKVGKQMPVFAGGVAVGAALLHRRKNERYHPVRRVKK